MINKIFHVDMDCYFASVEMSLNPKLKNIPMCVGGRNMHGVVSSANYIARKLGVKSAMNLYEAKNICPNLTIVDAKHNLYEEISDKIHLALSKYIKKIERASIDEWYIDVTDSVYEQWQEIEFATFIKNLIYKEFNLNCSVGNSFTLFLAKTATDLCKPNGFLTLDANNYYSYLQKIELKDICGIGKSTLKILNEQFNIFTVDDILNAKNELIIKEKLGIMWSKLKFSLQGIETNYVNPVSRRKNLGRSYSVKGFSNFDEAYILIKEIIDSINSSLSRFDFLFKTINMKITMKDKDYISKSLKYTKYVDKTNFSDVLKLFEEYVKKEEYNNIKNISITTSNLIYRKDLIEENSLFDNETLKNLSVQEKIANKVNSKLNKNLVYLLSNKKKQY